MDIRLSNLAMSKPILTYDGRVVEVFFDSMEGSSRRIHVGHIRTIALVPVSRGKEAFQLQISGEYMIVAVDVSASVAAQVGDVVAAVQRTIAGG
jgi:hypothetical protein